MHCDECRTEVALLEASSPACLSRGLVGFGQTYRPLSVFGDGLHGLADAGRAVHRRAESWEAVHDCAQQLAWAGEHGQVLPRRQIIRDSIQTGIERGQIRPDLDIERVLDLTLGALFAAVFASGRPGTDWPEQIIDALWPALRNDPQDRSTRKRRK